MENREPPHRQQRDNAAKLKGKAFGDEDVVWHALDPAAALEQAAARSEGLSAAEAAVRLGQFGPN
ncbi:cation-transporting P-type ATPase, partial [Aurantimonas sp. C2-5-R2]